MNGLRYQLKSIARDKLCILTFLLPIVVGAAINLLSDMDFSVMNQVTFGVVQQNLEADTAAWLEELGTVMFYTDKETLVQAIKEPATSIIGVVQSERQNKDEMVNENSIQTILSGDELHVYTELAMLLPQLYQQRNAPKADVTMISKTSNTEGMKALLIAITVVTAAFMGCTYNAMNIISEKEEGIAIINQILPMSTGDYILRKILIGFIGGMVSTILTALICVRIELEWIFPLLLLILLSALVAAGVGLLIGGAAWELMVGIVWIKAVMIVFLALPILCYFIVPRNSILFGVSYLIPSSAAFYGLMDLQSGGGISIAKPAVLVAHCIACILLIRVSKRKIAMPEQRRKWFCP